jgi:hypothetical protein
MTESRIEFKTFDFDIMLDHRLSRKLKLIRKDKFNYLINTLTIISNLICYQNSSLEYEDCLNFHNLPLI